jgi:polyisoprenoid-binding protein YceI
MAIPFRSLAAVRILLGLFAACTAYAGGAPSAADGFRAYLCDGARSTVSYHVVSTLAKPVGINHAPACTVWVSRDTSAFRISVSMPVRGFKSGIGLRDSHAMKAVEADSFPQVAFTSESVKPKEGRLGPYTVAGTLAFHGKTRAIEVAAQPEIKDGVVAIRGGFPISLSEYQVKPPSLMGTKVKDRVDMTFELFFKLPPAE